MDEGCVQKILIVEDSESDRYTYCRYLQMASDFDCQILEAANLAEGLELWRKRSPNLVLIDVNLHDGSGLELLEVIQENCSQPKLPVIMLTGQPDAKQAVQAMKLGARDYLFKEDITAEFLKSCVFTALQEIIVPNQASVKELSENENRFRQLAENIHQVFYLTDVETGKVLYVSPSYETIWGRSCQSLYDNPISYQETIYSEDIEIARQSYEGSRLGQVTETEYRIFRLDGSLRWISDRNFPIYDQTGKLYRVCGIAEDITEKKEAQIQLQKTEQLFQEAQRIARIGNWELDLRSNYLYWSDQVFRIFEIDSQRFIPSYEGFLATIYPDDRDMVNDAYTQHLREQRPYQMIYRILMPDGRIKYVQAQCETLFAKDLTPLVSQGTVQDITEIKQAELLLQNLNQSLEITIAERTRELSEINILQQTILDGTDLAIISTDREGFIKTFNHGAEKMLGYSAEEIIGKYTPDLFFIPEEMQQIAQSLSAKFGLEVEANVKDINLKTQPVIQEQEVIHVRKDGSHLPVQLSVNPLINEQQQVIGFLGISRDITLQKESDRQRQEAEEALRKSEMRFRRVFESDVVGMIFTNFAGEIFEANDRFLEIMGYSRDELEKGLINWAAMTSAEYRQLDLDAIEHLKQHRSIQPWEKVYIHKDGHSVHVLVGVALLSEEDDTCACVVVDISDRKQIEIERQRLLNRLALALKSGAIGCWEWSIVNQVMTWDKQTYEIHGIPEDSPLTYEIWANILHPEDLQPTEILLQQALTGKGEYDSEYRVIHRDGTTHFLKGYGIVVRDNEGNSREMIGINFDISDRKRDEIELKNANLELKRLLKLREETLTLREDMSNMIVHDLRNPLTGILLGAHIVQQYLIHNPSANKAINKLNQIIDSGKRMQKMIDSLLFMAKLESGKFLLNPIATDLHELGNKILNDFELMAKNAKVQLLGELPPQGNQINVDATILQRVIENLISNALKFSPQNSPVIVRLDYLADNHLRITVADRGPGISQDQQEQIFEKFEIGEFKQNISQIGLGLAFCKLAVEAHGGTLAIAANRPQGSIFTVEI